MVELASEPGHSLYRQSFAGDSFNTAVYLARGGLQVEYLTCLGEDGLSDAIMARLQEEGIDGSRVRRMAGRQPGLYLIRNDASGERYFSYWRDHSPARELFDQPVDLTGIANFYFTGITLAVCRAGLDNLVDLLEQLRRDGCVIIFDPNYRPTLWASLEQAQEHYRKVLPLCDTVLPTLDDDIQLWGITSVDACRHFYLGMGVKELVIKAPGLVAHACSGPVQVVKQAAEVAAVDTTGAGDSFNAGYLASRLRGADMDQAIDAAQALSAMVVQRRGAIAPRDHNTFSRKR
jgi:2-dehydro-3-deoxygluconokinase